MVMIDMFLLIGPRLVLTDGCRSLACQVTAQDRRPDCLTIDSKSTHDGGTRFLIVYRERRSR